MTAQNRVLDSLLSVPLESLNDSLQVGILNKIGYEYYMINIDSTAHYAQKSLSISEENNFKIEESRALNLLGIVAQFKGDLNHALTLNIKAYNIGEEINSVSNIASSANELSIIYEQLNDIEQSINYAMIALEGARKMEDNRFIGFMLSNLAKYHLEEGNFEKVVIYKDELIDLARMTNNCELLSEGYFLSGKLQFEDKKFELSLNSYNKSLDAAKTCDDQYFSSFSYKGISEIHFKNGDFLLAKQFIDKANTILEEIGDLDSHGENYLLESDILFSLGLEKDGETALLKGLAYAQKSKKLDYEKQYLSRLSRRNKEKGNFKKAFAYSEEANEVQRKISDQNKAIVMLELERKYNLEKKDVELQLLEEQKSKDAQTIKSRTFLVIASSLFAALVGLIAFFIFLGLKRKADYSSKLEQEVEERTQELQKSNRLLQNSNQELERFAYISSHDLKEPLKNINSFTKLIKNESTDKGLTKIKEYANILENCSNQLNTLVSDILDYSMIKSDLKIQSIDLNQIIEQLKSDLDSSLNIKNAIIIADNLPTIKTDKSSIYRIFKNLIENGIKYNTSKQPQVNISTQVSPEKVILVFADNGIGIDKKFHEIIFKMFKRLHNKDNYAGSGIGLSTVKAVVERLKGTIKVVSEPKNGSEFIVTLPQFT